jgi:regulatory protein
MLLGYRGRSEHELEERLRKKGFGEDEIRETVLYLKHAGMLDDQMLAENLRRQAFSNKLLGYAGAKRFMSQRGLSRDVIETSLDYDEDREIATIQKLMDKKFRTLRHHSDADGTRKAVHFLLRRGFSLSTIRKALKIIFMDRETEA